MAYWYKVAAVPFSSDSPFSVTEALSEAVRGVSDHTFSWSTTVLSGGASDVRVSADRIESGFAYSAAISSGESTVDAGRFDETGWGDIGEAFGSVEAGIAGAFDITGYDGRAFVAYADSGGTEVR